MQRLANTHRRHPEAFAAIAAAVILWTVVAASIALTAAITQILGI